MWYWVLVWGGIAVCICQIFGTRRVLRPPMQLLFGTLILVQLAAYFLLRYLVYNIELLMAINPKYSKLIAMLNSATDYDQWEKAAIQLDQSENRNLWKERKESILYNWSLIEDVINGLRKSKADNDPVQVMHILQACLQKEFGGVHNEALYSKTYIGTKKLIEQYVAEVLDSLQWLNEVPFDSRATQAALEISSAWRLVHAIQMHSKLERAEERPVHASFSKVIETLTIPEDISPTMKSRAEEFRAKLHLFETLRVSYGEPALCLSGGAGFGAYHLGVLKALIDLKLLPRIISGTSAGAIFASMICCRTDEELKDLITPDLHVHTNPFPGTGWEKLKRVFNEGAMFDIKVWQEKASWMAPNNMTFLEAFHKTGRVLNITVSSKLRHGPPMILNHVTTPNVIIASAIIASAGIPYLVKPIGLHVKEFSGKIAPLAGGESWRDGSIENDIPMSKLSESFRARFFVVSQTNPHIVPFFFYNRGESGRPSFWRRRTGGWRGGFLLSALELILKESMKMHLRIMQGLELLPYVLGQDWSALFLQDFSGDVTVCPSPRLDDYTNILTNPTRERLKRCIEDGQRLIWGKIAMIRNRVSIDKKLAEIIDSNLRILSHDNITGSLASFDFKSKY